MPSICWTVLEVGFLNLEPKTKLELSFMSRAIVEQMYQDANASIMTKYQ
jgi:hypothetical protein